MPDSGRAPVQNWLTLGSASELLGVSESTIRRWADAGDVRSYRTRGGHRRILEEDLRQLVTAHAGAAPSRDTDRISDIAIGRIKRRISRGRQGGGSATTAFAGLDDEARDRMRRLGRQLVDLFARYVASNTKGERFTEDAHALGREYGRTLVTSGVGLTAAVQTFNAMRRSLEETASQIAAEAGLSAEDAVEAVEATLGLADTILEAMAEVYEQTLARA